MHERRSILSRDPQKKIQRVQIIVRASITFFSFCILPLQRQYPHPAIPPVPIAAQHSVVVDVRELDGDAPA
ncbi:hypothetical protein EDD85DRAFT_954572 [Armillaria nabsnona]|nr:hypothetical protein EDD85DRAFT_954572 [Armillaria nabsnona]